MSGTDVRMDRVAAARSRTEDWRDRYARFLSVTDFLVLVWVVFGTQIAWLGTGAASVTVRSDDIPEISYWVFSIVLILVWMGFLDLFGTRDYRVIGSGTAEYSRIVRGGFSLFGVIAIVAFLARIDVARGYLLIAFPCGLAVLAFSRWLWRQWLGLKRLTGDYSARVLLVGSTNSVREVGSELTRSPSAGYYVVGACVPEGQWGTTVNDSQIPIFGAVSRAIEVMDELGADTLVVTSTDELTPGEVRRLSWELEPGVQHLAVAPNLVDIGGPRIVTRPVSGLSLMHVETPKYAGTERALKRLFDIVASLLGIVLLSPLLLVLGFLVSATSVGPMFFKQERVGLKGEHFTMLKFRSMVRDAEAKLNELHKIERAEGNTVMFKMKDDPRVTPIGKFMRRFSLDELPQLFNVLGGNMSLVGPRPPLVREVAAYEDEVRRRFLVKPGITGLWQVSGRSDLSWEETVRLDLYYVENWSLTGDAVILWRTARAVFGRGAY